MNDNRRFNASGNAIKGLNFHITSFVLKNIGFLGAKASFRRVIVHFCTTTKTIITKWVMKS